MGAPRAGMADMVPALGPVLDQSCSVVAGVVAAQATPVPLARMG